MKFDQHVIAAFFLPAGALCKKEVLPANLFVTNKSVRRSCKGVSVIIMIREACFAIY
jgi:hypothetical protein